MDWCNNWCVQAVALGVLLGVGFVVPGLWFMALVGLIWFAMQLSRSAVVSAWYFVCTAWFVKYAIALSWTWSVYPIDWLEFSSPTLQLFVIGVYWLSGALWLSLGGLVVAGYWYFAQKICSQKIMLLTLPCVWLVSELVGACMFSVFTLGSGGVVSSNLSFGFVGYHLAQHWTLLQLATLAGVYGLTIVLLALAIILAIAWRRGWSRVVLVAIAVLVLSNQVTFISGDDTPDHTVAVVDTDYPKNTLEYDVTDLVQSENKRALEEALVLDSDYILFPENSQVFDQSLASTTLRAYLQFRYGDATAVLIDSGRVQTDQGVVAQAIIFNPDTSRIQQTQKQYLVPQGEYVPSLYAFVLKTFGFGEVVDLLQARFAHVPGESVEAALFDADMPAVLFCFESVSPTGVRSLLSDGHDAPFVAHVVSHAWFNQSDTLQQQLDTMLRVQAVWNDIDIVSAGNQAAGKLYTSQGLIRYPTEVTSTEYWQIGQITF